MSCFDEEKIDVTAETSIFNFARNNCNNRAKHKIINYLNINITFYMFFFAKNDKRFIDNSFEIQIPKDRDC